MHFLRKLVLQFYLKILQEKEYAIKKLCFNLKTCKWSTRLVPQYYRTNYFLKWDIRFTSLDFTVFTHEQTTFVELVIIRVCGTAAGIKNKHDKTGVFNDPLLQTHSTPVANIVFCGFFSRFVRTDGTTDNMCENNDPYRPWLWVGRVD